VSSLFDSRDFNERLFFPRRDRSVPPEGSRELEVVVGDATLHVRCYPPMPARPTVLLFHGNGEVVSDYDPQAEYFARAGANLAVMDYRGYGRSTGTPTLRSALEDAHRVVAEVRSAAPVIVMGRSLGSACAADLYGASPEGVIGFIIESGFVDLDALIRRRGLTPPKELRPEDRTAFDPGRKLAKGRAPLLVLHGADDTMIAPDEARRIYAAAGTSQKELVIIADHGHNDVSMSPDYWAAISRFVGVVSM